MWYENKNISGLLTIGSMISKLNLYRTTFWYRLDYFEIVLKPLKRQII